MDRRGTGVAVSTPQASGTLERLFGIDPRGLAALRIAIGCVLLVDLALRTDHFSALYTNAGVLPHFLFEPEEMGGLLSLHTWRGTFWYQTLLFGAAAVFAAMLVVGRFTRIATGVSWVLLTSLHIRSPLTTDYGDEMLRLIVFWSIFLPLGSRWSLDARRHATRTDGSVLSVASAALLIQIASIYFFTALLKSGTDWRSDGTAIYYTLSQDWWLKPFGAWLTSLFAGFELLTFVTIGFEFLAPLLLFSPWLTTPIRILLVPLFWCFQYGLGVSIELALMPFITSGMMLVFLPPIFWDGFERLRPVRALAALAATRAVQALATTTRAPIPGLVAARELGVGLLLLYVLAYNVSGVSDVFRFPSDLEPVGEQLRINQRWSMYAPNGPRHDGWLVIPGVLASGETINLWEPGLGWEKPRRINDHHDSVRWAMYEFNLTQESFDGPDRIGFRRRYAKWLCWDWNARHEGPQRLVSLELRFILERTPPPGQTPGVERRVLYRERCDSEPPPGMTP